MNQIIHDISMPLYEGMMQYPNNPDLQIELREGTTTYHSLLTVGTHTGTHIDAPRHIDENGAGIDAIDLDRLVGKCRVLDCTNVEDEIHVNDLKPYNIASGERILFKTNNSELDYTEFRDDYISLSGDAADYLAQIGIKSCGIDYLSIKKRGSSDTRAHDSLLNRGIPIIEGLILRDITPGEYFLCAMPLKLKNGDAGLARVILIENTPAL